MRRCGDDSVACIALLRLYALRIGWTKRQLCHRYTRTQPRTPHQLFEVSRLLLDAGGDVNIADIEGLVVDRLALDLLVPDQSKCTP